MDTNAIVERAKQLKEEADLDGVIELLTDYVEENDDKEAFALYSTSLASKFYLENNINTSDLFSDSVRKYEGMSDELALQASAHMFADMISTTYLNGKSLDDQMNMIYSILQIEIEALGKRLRFIDEFQKQVNCYYNTMVSFGMGSSFYYIFSQFLDWSSELSEKVWEYSIIKAGATVRALKSTYEDIYNEYTKEMNKEGIPAFKTRPVAQADVNFVMSDEDKAFWKGYFELVASTREKELEQYSIITEDENHWMHPECSAWTFLHHKLDEYRDMMTSENYLNSFQALKKIVISESDFTDEIKEARKIIPTIKVLPGAKLFKKIKELLNKKS